MKCPCCGHEMVLDGHTKIDKFMCYECGYIEGRRVPARLSKNTITNFERMRALDINEAAAFVSKGLGVDPAKLASWLERPVA